MLVKKSANITSDLPSIPANYSRLVARELDLQERDLNELLVGTALSVDQIMHEDTLLTATQQVRILSNGIGLANDHAFGLRLGKRLTPSTHGALGFLANSSPDLVTAVKSFQDFLPTRMSFIRVDLSRSAQWLECRWYIEVDAAPEIIRSFTDAVSMALIDLVEFILGRSLVDGQIYFAFDEPDYSDRYADYIPCPVVFSAQESMLRIPVELMCAANASANHVNYAAALKQCQLMLSQLPNDPQATKYRVQKLILSYPPGRLSEDYVAASMFITKRTLARRLSKEGCGFRQIKEAILAEQAAGYLRDTNFSVESIAGLLNYHDSANFRRAFKRWFNCTPSAFRHQLIKRS
jgi:AraC-like DNA-binding protein